MRRYTHAHSIHGALSEEHIRKSGMRSGGEMVLTRTMHKSTRSCCQGKVTALVLQITTCRAAFFSFGMRVRWVTHSAPLLALSTNRSGEARTDLTRTLQLWNAEYNLLRLATLIQRNSHTAQLDQVERVSAHRYLYET